MAQSLDAFKIRDTIIGYEPPLILYGSINPLVGETAQISYPWFACDLDLHFLGVCSVHASLPMVA